MSQLYQLFLATIKIDHPDVIGFEKILQFREFHNLVLEESCKKNNLQPLFNRLLDPDTGIITRMIESCKTISQFHDYESRIIYFRAIIERYEYWFLTFLHPLATKEIDKVTAFRECFLLADCLQEVLPIHSKGGLFAADHHDMEQIQQINREYFLKAKQCIVEFFSSWGKTLQEDPELLYKKIQQPFRVNQKGVFLINSQTGLPPQAVINPLQLGFIWSFSHLQEKNPSQVEFFSLNVEQKLSESFRKGIETGVKSALSLYYEKEKNTTKICNMVYYRLPSLSCYGGSSLGAITFLTTLAALFNQALPEGLYATGQAELLGSNRVEGVREKFEAVLQESDFKTFIFPEANKTDLSKIDHKVHITYKSLDDLYQIYIEKLNPQKSTQGKKKIQAEQVYIELLRMAYADNMIATEERELLELKRKQLKISRVKSKTLESQVKLEQNNSQREQRYLELLKMAYADDVLDPKERELLDLKREQLDISVERGLFLETQIKKLKI
ncbi:MAG: TerB family tellurite resistance protein [SAR324 cluster bacterium]|nr:TerB family tellurite resistance protein [SAR324 cluster bacterium]